MLGSIKVAVVLKLIYKFSTIPFKVPSGFFEEIVNLILKFISIFKKLRIAKQSSKRTKLENLYILN